ncbi:MAG: hypothetical protein E6K21_01770 [Gammaproteobacteria bacterium]|nr:MAG: hypothetical protein E6K21_01770 [Gammaproteobacteria bacterium]
MNSDSPKQAPLSGMTANERLYSRGLLPEFDAAARRRDLPAMVHLLRKVEISEADANSIAAAVLANPSKYGL